MALDGGVVVPFRVWSRIRNRLENAAVLLAPTERHRIAAVDVNEALAEVAAVDRGAAFGRSPQEDIIEAERPFRQLDPFADPVLGETASTAAK